MTRPIPCLFAAWAAVLLCLAGPVRAQAPESATASPAPSATSVKPAHGIAMHGDLKYGPGFKHFDYVNPDAPKGGTVRLAGLRTFDTLNPFTLKGYSAAGADMVFDTLMAPSADEPFSEYGLVAKSIETPPDRSWVAFNLRHNARFHDGTPITADDVVWSFNTLITKGHPQFRILYGGVKSVKAEGRYRVLFTFKPGVNRELPLILGQFPIFSKKYWQGKDFAKTTLTPPLGSGPYRISEVEPNRSITYERVPDYWGKDLPVNVGRYNFGKIRYDYYRDSTIALEAIKAGAIDFRNENVSRYWAVAYDIPALREGFLVKKFVRNHMPTGMQAFVFNTRKPFFKDPRVRHALAYAFDFEWTNRVLFYGAYKRTKSYFSNSELAATGLPGPAELKILEPYRDKLPPEVFTKPYEPPSTDGTHDGLRKNLLHALDMLKAAGWVVRDGKLVNEKTGTPMRFEILLVQSGFERIVLPFIGNLKRLGIDATVRTVDGSQYINRLRNFDFDMVVTTWPESLSPGNEQYNNWSSAAARTPGSNNLAGISDPVIDKLIGGVVQASTRASLVAHTRALDRVLLWGHYVIPQWHITGDRLAFWNKFGYPKVEPIQGFQFNTWWVDPKKAADLEARKAEVVSTEAKEHLAKAKQGKPSTGTPWGWIAAGIVAILLALGLMRRRKRKDASS